MGYVSHRGHHWEKKTKRQKSAWIISSVKVMLPLVAGSTEKESYTQLYFFSSPGPSLSRFPSSFFISVTFMHISLTLFFWWNPLSSQKSFELLTQYLLSILPKTFHFVSVNWMLCITIGWRTRCFFGTWKYYHLTLSVHVSFKEEKRKTMIYYFFIIMSIIFSFIIMSIILSVLHFVKMKNRKKNNGKKMKNKKKNNEPALRTFLWQWIERSIILLLLCLSFFLLLLCLLFFLLLLCLLFFLIYILFFVYVRPYFSSWIFLKSEHQ